MARRPEHDHERGCIVPFYAGMGMKVRCTSARVHAKGVTPGIPDLIVHWPAMGFSFWHETKVGRSRQTVEQMEFEADAMASGTPYVMGDIESAYDFVCWLGVARRVGPTVVFAERCVWRVEAIKRRDISPGALAEAWSRSAEHYNHIDRWRHRRG